ncbi:hypothetical protein QVD17_02035 [Tagetes erecta]|uniref:Homeobox domain-containing protein n=1 Tax=Tagetes erecta TaxID=13708 RepID=A0AAD8LBV2_TARER|nr:hypothetical protein QVD17_02035 [Tagetes erecta]
MAEEEKMMRGENNNNIMVDGSTSNYNCSYNDHQTQTQHHDVNATSTFETNPLEIYNFESSHNSVSHNSVLFWKGPSSSSSSKHIISSESTDFYDHFDDSISLQRCVFPCEPNERPSQGLSLSLSSANPSSIGLQSFELVRPQQQHHYQHHHHQGYFGKSISTDHDHDMMIQDRFLVKPGNIINSSGGDGEHDGDDGGGSYNNNHQSAQYNIRSSRYLVPAQELLSEFCNLGSKQSDEHPSRTKAAASNPLQDHGNFNNVTSNSKAKSLSSVEFMELQKRRTKLLQMLEEVDRRYKHYCDQMKAVVSSFEAVAGYGAAKVYSSLASKAMSRHFKCLRDGIVSQIKAIKAAMGEKDISAPGASRGETPRLRTLDQTLRQQRAFQQMTMDTHPWRPQRGLPERSVTVLRAWLFEHFLHPYPNDVDKHILARQTGLSRSQVSNWFINARVRLWKPMVEEMYMEEIKTNQETTMEGSSDGFNPNPPQTDDQKPTAEELVRIDSECLSSIINHSEKMDHHLTNKTQDHDFNQSFTRVTNSFGAVELDFSTYNNHNNFGGGGVSLTLGLQQHGGGDGGAGAAGLFYPRDNIETSSSVQYSSLLEGDQGQNLPYRNLMGAQLLHDLAG